MSRQRDYILAAIVAGAGFAALVICPVSYTHLTLPTILRV